MFLGSNLYFEEGSILMLGRSGLYRLQPAGEHREVRSVRSLANKQILEVGMDFSGLISQLKRKGENFPKKLQGTRGC
jgi:hypothetical protein